MLERVSEPHAGRIGEDRTSFPLPLETWGRLGHALRLTARELEVVRLLFDGGTEASVAAQLGVSAHTVHSHLDRIYKKTAVNGRCELILRVFREYLQQQHAAPAKRPPTAPHARPARA